MNTILLFWIALHTTTELCTGVTVFLGDGVSLSCPNSYDYRLQWFAVSRVGNLSRIASYITTPSISIFVDEPWSSRGWNVSATNGDLIIPEVLLRDDGRYYCAPSDSNDDGIQVLLSVHVRPSLFTMEATPMPVEVNTSITGTCRANEIRPQPEEFYWRLGDTHIQGLRSTDSVNSTYPVFRVSSTFSHVAIADDNGKNLTCILVMQNGEDLRRRVRISIIGVGSPAGEKDLVTQRSILDNILVIALPVFGAICLLLAVIICIILKRKRNIGRVDSNDTNRVIPTNITPEYAYEHSRKDQRVTNTDPAPRHVYEHLRKNENNGIASTSMPQGDKNDSEPGIIAGTAVYENEGFDGSHDGINGTDDSASYTTMNETSSLNNDIYPTSFTQDRESDIITDTREYEYESIDDSQYEEPITGGAYVTHLDHLQHGNLPPQQHVYESVS